MKKKKKTTTSKNYYQAPLPFVGQKRMFIKEFKQVVNETISNDGEGWQIIDVFGGSGLLAHNAKQLKPQAQVIWNDFDDYQTELDYIDDLNDWRSTILKIQSKHGHERKEKLSPECKQEIINFLETKKQHPAFKMRLLNQWLAYSGQAVFEWEKFIKKDFWHSISLGEYKKDGYLDGVERISTDFLNILNDEKYQTAKTLLILDPPYLITQPTGYKQGMNIGEYLKLFSKIKKPFIFFSSTKSDFNYLFDYAIAEKIGNYKDFEDLKSFKRINILNSSYTFEDNLIYNY